MPCRKFARRCPYGTSDVVIYISCCAQHLQWITSLHNMSPVPLIIEYVGRANAF